MAKVLGRTWVSREEWAAQRQAAWQAQRQNMTTYLSSKEWRDKRDRAFVIWRVLGWTLTGGLLLVRLRFPTDLYGNARVLLAWPLPLLAAFGFGYALTLRSVSALTHHRMHRVGHHIGYAHLDTENEVYTERWYEIVPVTETVNRTESLLRGDKTARQVKKPKGLIRLLFWGYFHRRRRY